MKRKFEATIIWDEARYSKEVEIEVTEEENGIIDDLCKDSRDRKGFLPLGLLHICEKILTSMMRLRQNSVRFSMFVSGTRFENRSDRQIMGHLQSSV